MEQKSILANNIIALRKAHKLTQSELAEKLNYSDKTVSKWENGDAVPDLETLILISDYFGVSLDDLCKKELPIHKSLETGKTGLKTKIRQFTRNKIVITGLSVLLVWFFAMLVFVVVKLTTDISYWLTFIYALPISFIVLIVFCSIWGRKYLILCAISGLIWTLLLSIHLQSALLGVQNIWMIYLLGAVMQCAVVLWSFLRYRKVKKSDNQN